jgi:hypothetical protein
MRRCATLLAPLLLLPLIYGFGPRLGGARGAAIGTPLPRPAPNKEQSRSFLPNVFVAPSPTPTATPSPTQTPSPTLTPSVTPTPGPLTWDPRLDQRGAVLVPADVSPGEWYWRLIKAVWYAEHEPPFDGQHHIFADTLDPSGDRQPGVRIRVTCLDGATVYGDITTELKPGDLYAANFPMWVTAPAYRAGPFTGAPADAVTGLGMGTIEEPWRTSHTSYGFVWQWTVAVAVPSPTASPAPAVTPTATGTTLPTAQ